jgi:hypothetical protein
MQAGRELERSQRTPRRNGQLQHIFGIPDGSASNGYVKRERRPGRRTDFMNDPIVNAKREQALARMANAETQQESGVDTPALHQADTPSGRGTMTSNAFNAEPEIMPPGHTYVQQVQQEGKSFKRQKISERWKSLAVYEIEDLPVTPVAKVLDDSSNKTITIIVEDPPNRSLTINHADTETNRYLSKWSHLDELQYQDFKNAVLALDALADSTLAELPGSRVSDIPLTERLLHEMKAQLRGFLIRPCGGVPDGIPAGVLAH